MAIQQLFLHRQAHISYAPLQDGGSLGPGSKNDLCRSKCLIKFSMQENCILCSLLPRANLREHFSGFHGLQESGHTFAGVSVSSRRNSEGLSVLSRSLGEDKD